MHLKLAWMDPGPIELGRRLIRRSETASRVFFKDVSRIGDRQARPRARVLRALCSLMILGAALAAASLALAASTARPGNYTGILAERFHGNHMYVTLTVSKDSHRVTFREHCGPPSIDTTGHPLSGAIRRDLTFHLRASARPGVPGTEIVSGRFTGGVRNGHLWNASGRISNGCQTNTIHWFATAV